MFTEFVTKLLTLILGYAVPAYECVESIELLPTRIVDLRFWCKYWIIVNIWYIFDEITDALASRLTETASREEQPKYKMVSSPSLEMALHNNFLYFNHRIPMYRELKLAFIIYLSFPTTKAADIVYKAIFRPVMMLIMLCEWNIKWRLLPHLCETLDSFMCRARDLHWFLFRGVVHRSSRSSLPKVTEKNAVSKVPEKNAESKVPEKNAESKVTENNAEDIRSVSHLSSSPLSFIAKRLIEDIRHQIQRALLRSPADELVEAASRRLWGMETYQNKVHVFLGRRGFFDSFLCIWGKRSVGKSALLRLVRDSYAAGGASFDHVLFVGAGTGGCTVHNMQHAIVTSFGLDWPKMSLLDERYRARVICSSLLKREERALLLVDDVREHFHWWAVGLPLCQPYVHKIICAMRSRTVCAEMDTTNIIEMRCLGEDDAWNLFKDKVGIVDAQPPAHPHVQQLAKKMVAECRGLPLALCVIGRAMSSKADPREWRNAYNLLKAKHSRYQEYEGYSCLDILENELKDSFLVTSLWPKDGSIPTEPMRIMYQEDSSTNDEIVQVSEKKEFF